MHGEASIAAICRTFGVSQSAFYKRRRIEGWQRQNLSKIKKEHTVPPVRGAAKVPAQKQDSSTTEPDLEVRRDLVRRLFAAWERRLSMIEQQIITDELGAQNLGVEKQARALSLLVRDFEKLSGIHEQLSVQGAGAAGRAERDQPEPSADAEAWREALARRLERLCEAQAS